MKKLYFLVIFLVLSLNVQAQNTLKSYLYKERARSNNLVEFPAWGNSIDNNTMITFNKDSIMIINNESKDFFKLDSLILIGSGIDTITKDPWFGTQWLSTDKNKLNVKIVFQQFKSGIFIITIMYVNSEYLYQCLPYKKLVYQIV